jgi:hypothetical protein
MRLSSDDGSTAKGSCPHELKKLTNFTQTPLVAVGSFTRAGVDVGYRKSGPARRGV